jgi:hypothetical protein
MSSLKNPLLVAALALGLSGCLVGPDYHGAPAIPTGAAFQRGDGTTANAEPAARWWTALGDPELDHLIEVTLNTNPGVEVARARVREARANLRLQTATGLRQQWYQRFRKCRAKQFERRRLELVCRGLRRNLGTGLFWRQPARRRRCIRSRGSQ